MVNTNLVIRSALKKDIPSIVSFIEQLAEYEQLSQEVTLTEQNLRQALYGNHPVAEAIIASDADTPVGFALFYPNFSTFLGRTGLYLEDLYVLPQHRNRGIGRAMLIYLVTLAKQRGYGRLEWSVLNWNEPAIRLYRSIGATAMPQWIRYRLSENALEELLRGSQA